MDLVLGIASQGKTMEIIEELLGHHAGCDRHVGVLTALPGPLGRQVAWVQLWGYFGSTKTYESSMSGSFHAEGGTFGSEPYDT